MKQFKECARLGSINEQIFAHVFLLGFLIIFATIGCNTSTPENKDFILSSTGALGIGFLLLISSNRITYLDDSKSTLEIRWFFAYRFCYRRQRIPLSEVNQLTLLTITDSDGDKSYELNIEAVSRDQGLIKHSPDKIKIAYSQSLDPILKFGEKLSKLFRKKLVRA